MKLVILGTKEKTTSNYIKACKELGVEYEIIDLKQSNWLNKIKESKCDGILHAPFATTQYLKDMSDERTYFIEKHLNIPIYPSFDETYIYENKNAMAYWLESHDIPHAKTRIFYDKNEAMNFLKLAEYPLVFKTKIGSAGVGVKFIKTKKQGKRIIKKVFSKFKHFSRGYTTWIKTKRFKPFNLFIPKTNDKQYGHIMFQEKLDIKNEWRVIRIGESYFGHQKLLGSNNKHSGSNLVGWEAPPEKLLLFVKEICDIGNFNSMDVDIFETNDGSYYVNELQTIFGSYNPSQMYIDGEPGRYKFIDDKWIFEKGYFNQNGSMNLRVEHFIRILKEK